MNKILLIIATLVGAFFLTGCDKTTSLAYMDNSHLIGQDMGTYVYDNVKTHEHFNHDYYMNPERLPERQEMLHMNYMYMDDLVY